MILPKERDPRFITERRGGTLQDADHHLLAVWAADSAQHVLHLFENMQSSDDRPRQAIELARAWVRCEITLTQVRNAAGAANAIRAARAAAEERERDEAGRLECQWQREQLPARSENSCSTIRSCATKSAGLYSMADTFQGLLRQVVRLPAMPLDATERHPPVWAAMLGGAGLGLVWGITTRLWMRLIATTPEFSLPGTAGILTITTLFGAWTGLAFVARRRGWRGWRHYVPRSLAVIFFIPFGIAGGLPLMLTVLVATLGITQRAMIGLWVVAGLVMLVAVGTDIVIPMIVTVIAPALAIAWTGWEWSIRRWHGAPWLRAVGIRLERIGRAILLLLAAFGLWTVASGIMNDKPGVIGLMAVFFYLLLLYPLFLALRVGLAPRASAPSHAATQVDVV